jgi:peptide/nickel transport system ATP-binding protein
VTVQKQILELLARLQSDHGMAMILISHDFGVVSGMADRIAVMYAGQFVETAAADETFRQIRHPYTEALLNAIPRFDQPSHTRLQAIGGRPPNMVQPPHGCRFAARCRYGDEHCTQTTPPLTTTENNHSFRCLYPLDSAASTDATPVRLLDGATV